MLLAPTIERGSFELALTRKKVELSLFFELKVSKKALAEVLNEVARAKAQLVDAGRLSSDQFAREMEHVKRRYQLDLTLDGYAALAERFDREEEYDKAAKYYRQALVKAPENVEIMVNLGATLGKAERYKESVSILRRALELKPTNAKALNNLAASLHRMEAHEEALRLLDKAIRLDPEYGTPYLNKGRILCEKGDHVRAAECFRMAVTAPRPKLFALAYLGTCLLEAGRAAEAIESFEQGIRSGYRDPGMLFNRALALGSVGRKEEALKAFAEFEAHPDAKALLSDPALAEKLKAARREFRGTQMLADLVNAVEIDLPSDVNFADWEQLSSHLASLRG